MSSIKSFVQLASCRCTTRGNTTRSLRVRSTLSFINFPKRHQRPFASGRSTSDPSNSTIIRQAILIALPTFCLLGFAYKHINPDFFHPLILDAPDPYHAGDANLRVVQYYPNYRAPTIEEVNDSLGWEEGSKCLGPPSDVLRYDIVRVPSNNPCEDEHIAAMDSTSSPDVVDENLGWIMWGVFDGHAGWETSTTLSLYLLLYVAMEFATLLPPNLASVISASPPHLIDQAIKTAFLHLDHDIIQTGADAALGPRFFADAFAQLSGGYAGSCALLSLYDRTSKLLRVACTGDSRAVLGRRNVVTGKWEAIPLSVDQTGYNETEAARIRAEHPDEPDPVQNGRVLGMAVTRAFGDGRWKWPREVQEKAKSRFYGPRLLEGFRTPTYLTAEPVITTTKISPENRDFVIMASDGLWDQLSSEQAVDLVGRWLESHDPEMPPKPQHSLGLLSASPQPDVLKRTKPEEGRAYTNQRFAKEENFVVVDENAATHLARNALGGGDEDLLRGAMMMQAPFARNVRDDITIQVVFFGEGNQKAQGPEIENW